MKTILCYGDSNLRGFIPGTFNESTGLSDRFEKDKRWTGLLQIILGEKYNIIEEGINGGTTTLDEKIPGRPYRNGLTQLPVCLESHYPIDIVIFMLGTNDTKLQFNRTLEEITEGMRQLVKIVKTGDKGPASAPPKIIVIAPQPIIKIINLHPQYDAQPIQKSKELAKSYQQMAKEENCEFIDAGLIVSSSRLDGIHLDAIDHGLLGYAVAEKVRQMSNLLK
ncbi:MAG: SGNH/GDSL hydrolase family protein [Gammaproteobacteria bacterium]|nr:SGNH/GDSL hydrolase family protein [Gammaproteobacteria bacterium]